jgi:catechol 2,3-dioxygenase-like lactoylglutathione lyase family enzyme
VTVERFDHVGIVVDDIAAATDFFVRLGLEVQGTGPVEGGWVDRIVGLDGVRCDITMLGTPGGYGCVELVKFHAPVGRDGDGGAPANVGGLRHVAFRVDDIDAAVAEVQADLVGEVVQFRESFKLCYLHGPEGIIVELTERLGH